MLAGGERVLVAVSGGADSVALVHLLLSLAAEWRLSLHVLHVDHGLRPDSARDAAFVREIAERLGLPAEVTRVTVRPQASLEEAARVARYRALEAAADRLRADRIAVGHTADDQAETVLMRLLEGAGLRGLGGIPAVRGRIIRPLLDIRRRDLVAELVRVGVPWIEDPSNDDSKFLRNRVRHELLPLLGSAYRADIVPALARTARLAREATDSLDTLAAHQRERLATLEPDGAVTLPLAPLRELPAPVAAELLRQAAVRAGGRHALRGWGHRVLRRVLATPPPRRGLRVAGVTIDVSVGRVRLGAQAPTALAPRELSLPGRVELPEIGCAMEARRLAAANYRVPRDRSRVAFDAAALREGLTARAAAGDRLMVRARRRGDRFTPFATTSERRLKTFLIDAKLPRWERGRVPVVEYGDVILWLAGARRSALAPVHDATREVIELALVPLAEPGVDRVAGN
jgi:tRNA(Ile)-lysidine synthase